MIIFVEIQIPMSKPVNANSGQYQMVLVLMMLVLLHPYGGGRQVKTATMKPVTVTDDDLQPVLRSSSALHP